MNPTRIHLSNAVSQLGQANLIHLDLSGLGTINPQHGQYGSLYQLAGAQALALSHSVSNSCVQYMSAIAYLCVRAAVWTLSLKLQVHKVS